MTKRFEGRCVLVTGAGDGAAVSVVDGGLSAQHPFSGPREPGLTTI